MRRETLHAYLLLLPALVLLVAFTHWPAIATLIDSLYATPHGSRPAPFVGLDNYTDLLDDPGVLAGAAQQRVVCRRHDPVSIVLAFLMALAVNEALPGRALLRMAYFLPTMLPMIAVANIWMFFYTPDYGLFDRIMALVRRRPAQLAGRCVDRAAGDDRRRGVEGSRVLHDLLPRRLADHADRSARGRGAGRARRAGTIFVASPCRC